MRFLCSFICWMAVLTVLLVSTTGCTTHSTRNPMATQVLGPDGQIITIGGDTSRTRRGQQTSRDGAVVAPTDYWWKDDGGAGKPSIILDLSEQRGWFFRGDRIIGETPISTGREGYRTPAGSFRVTQKSKDHVSNLYGDYVNASGEVVVANVGVRRDKRPPGTRFQGASMPYFMRIHGAVGLHAGYLPGYAASHGCIRLPMEMARHFFDAASHGTPVIVRP